MEGRHKMNQAESYPSGAERWKCYHCGYEFVIQWLPYHKVILSHGGENEYEHFISYHELVPAQTAVSPAPTNESLNKFIDSLWGEDDIN